MESTESVCSEKQNTADVHDDRGNDGVAEWTIADLQLSSIGSASALPALLRAAADPLYKVRDRAIRALGEIADPSALPTLLVALTDTYPRVRWQAVRALAQLGETAVVPLLQVAVNTSEDDGVRGEAIEALGRLGAAAVLLEFVHLLLHDGSRHIRETVAITLPALRDTSAVPALILALRDEVENVRICAIEALGELRDNRAVAPLIEMLADPAWVLRYPAAEALGKIGDPAALPALEQLLLKEQDQAETVGKGYMLKVATEAISRIQAKRENPYCPRG